jgi:putative ABC transport system permease protein
MNSAINEISLSHLAIAFLPVLPVLAILYRWKLDFGKGVYAIARMLGQLLIIGYFLKTIFAADSALIVLLVLSVMVFASSWIAMGSIGDKRLMLYKSALLAIVIGGGINLVIVCGGVLRLEPWYLPQYVVPLAGMIFANAMNAVSLAAERMRSETKNGVEYLDARKRALQAALIPVTNSLFAVGLVSLPGMMTGQIISGVSPLIAARYQIMVMCMVFGSAGVSTALFLTFSRSVFQSLAPGVTVYKPEQ